VQRFSRNDGAATDTDGAKAASCDVIVNRAAAKAGCPAGFQNAVAKLGCIVLAGLHYFRPIWPARTVGGLHGMASYACFAAAATELGCQKTWTGFATLSRIPAAILATQLRQRFFSAMDQGADLVGGLVSFRSPPVDLLCLLQDALDGRAR